MTLCLEHAPPLMAERAQAPRSVGFSHKGGMLPQVNASDFRAVPPQGIDSCVLFFPDTQGFPDKRLADLQGMVPEGKSAAAIHLADGHRLVVFRWRGIGIVISAGWAVARQWHLPCQGFVRTFLVIVLTPEIESAGRGFKVGKAMAC